MPSTIRSVAVIGAGLAGLCCARRLHAAGLAVTLFDKGRRPGGRLATRRVDGMTFDHGAPHAAARGEAFRTFLEGLGPTVTTWTGRHGEPVWIGVPGMSALPQAVAAGGVGAVLAGRHVAFLYRNADGWHVRHRDAAGTPPGLVSAEGGEMSGPFDAAVVAVPSPQAAGLLTGIGHALADRVGGVAMAPYWTLLLAYASAQDGPDTASPKGSPLDTVVHDSARPGRAGQPSGPDRPGPPDCWVAHARPDWSRAHLEMDAAAVLPLLRDAFASETGLTTEPTYAAAHRWRYARVETPLGEPFLLGQDRLALCGDWCIGPHVEAAFTSGTAAAEAILAS